MNALISKFINLALPIFARLAGAAFQFGIFLLIVINLNAEESANIFAFQLWSGLASAVGQFGLSVVSLRISCRTDVDRNRVAVEILAVLMLLLVTTTIAGSLGSALYYGLVAKANGDTIFCFVLMVCGLSGSQITADLYRATGRNVFSSIASVAAPVAGFVVLGFSIYFAGVSTTTLISRLSYATFFCGFLITTHLAKTSLSNFEGKLHYQKIYISAKRKVAVAFNSFKTSTMAFLAMQIDQLILSVISSPRDFSAYVVGARLAQIVSVVISSVNPVISTQIFAKQGKNEVEEAQMLLNRWAAVLSIFSIFLAILGYFIIPIVREKYLGSQTEDVISVISYLTLAALFNLATGPKGFYLWISGYDKLVRRLLTQVMLATCIAASSYAVTKNIKLSAALISLIFISQYVVEMVLMKKHTKIFPFNFKASK